MSSLVLIVETLTWCHIEGGEPEGVAIGRSSVSGAWAGISG